MIAEPDSNGDVLFLGHDEQGKVEHCCSLATDGTLRKKDMAGSDKHYAFRLVANEEQNTVRVFEGAMDLLSYVTLLRAENEDYKSKNLISLLGIYLP